MMRAIMSKKPNAGSGRAWRIRRKIEEPTDARDPDRVGRHLWRRSAYIRVAYPEGRRRRGREDSASIVRGRADMTGILRATYRLRSNRIPFGVRAYEVVGTGICCQVAAGR